MASSVRGALPNTRDAANTAAAALASSRASNATRVASGNAQVVGLDAGARQQLGDDHLVHVGVLAQVERRRGGTRRLRPRASAAPAAAPRAAPRHGAASERGSIVRDRRATPPASRRARAAPAAREAARYPASALRGRREPRVDADQRLAIRLVLAMRIGVVRRCRQRQQFGRRRCTSRADSDSSAPSRCTASR